MDCSSCNELLKNETKPFLCETAMRSVYNFNKKYIIGDIGYLRFLNLRSNHIFAASQIPSPNGRIFADWKYLIFILILKKFKGRDAASVPF